MRDVRAWLFRIVRNAAVSYRRRAGHDGMELLDTLSVAASPQEDAERRAVVHETLEAIADLPERQREALLSIAVQGRSQDEVARELGVSTTAVRQLVHRARTSIRAAATAIAPLSLVARAADAGLGASDSMTMRIAGLIAGGGSAGAAVTFAKAGAVAGVAATAISGSTFVEPPPPRAAEIERAASAPPARAPERASSPVPRIVPVVTVSSSGGAGQEPAKAEPRSAGKRRPVSDPEPRSAARASNGDDDDDQRGESPERRGANGDEHEDREDTGADRQNAERDDGESGGGESADGGESKEGGEAGDGGESRDERESGEDRQAGGGAAAAEPRDEPAEREPDEATPESEGGESGEDD